MSLGRGEEIETLLEASSLGTPEARALRDTVSREQAAAVLRRVEELERQHVADRREVSTRDAFHRLAAEAGITVDTATEEKS